LLPRRPMTNAYRCLQRPTAAPLPTTLKRCRDHDAQAENLAQIGNERTNAVRQRDPLAGRDEYSCRATRPQQSVILRLDGRVAFAGGLAQTVEVGDLDMAPAVLDKIGLL